MNEELKSKLAKEFIEKSIKIGQKDIAIELGINTRSVRAMKKNDYDKYRLVEDALKYRYITGELDIKIKKIDNEFWLFIRDNKIIGIDLHIKKEVIEESKNNTIKREKVQYSAFRGEELFPLTQKEIKNLERKDIQETTVSNQKLREELKKMELFL